MQTQWRTGFRGMRTGLDYAYCQVAIQAEGIDFRDVFPGLRIIESAVLSSAGENGEDSDDAPEE